MGSSNDNLSNEEKFIIDFRIRHQWNIRTKTQLLFKLFIWAILTNWWISDKAGPFWRQLPTPANALRPTYINQLQLKKSKLMKIDQSLSGNERAKTEIQKLFAAHKTLATKTRLWLSHQLLSMWREGSLSKSNDSTHSLIKRIFDKIFCISSYSASWMLSQLFRPHLE